MASRATGATGKGSLAGGPRRVASRLALFLASLGVLLILLELATQVWIERFASSDSFQIYASLRQINARLDDPAHQQEEPRETAFTRHRYLGYIARPDWAAGANRHNAAGFRGEEIRQPKPPGELRIACLGGSTTYSTAVEDHTLSYPAVLERELCANGYPQTTVINAGLHNWTSWETLINFQLRVLELEPDVLVIYHGFNDIKPRFVWPRDRYRSDNSGFRAVAPSIFLPAWWEHSALARVVMTRLGKMEPHARLERTLDERSPDNHWGRFRIQLNKGTYPQQIFRKLGVETMLDANPPIWFERNLELVIDIAERRGIEVVLATFAYRPEGFGGSNPGSEHLRRAMTEMNDVQRGLAERRGVHLFDYEAVAPLDEQHFVDHIHMNEQGTAAKGRLFARFLLENVLAP